MITMSIDKDPVLGHLARLHALLNAPVLSAPELRSAIAAAISASNTSQTKHVLVDDMLQAAAALWNKGLNLPEGMDALNATLKQGALDLQWSSLEPPSLALAQQLRLAEQALKTAEIWSELDHWEAADAALGRCLALSSCLATAATSSASTADEVQQERAAVVLFSSLLLRLRASLRLGQELPASALLLRLKEMMSHAALPLRQRTMFTLDLLASLVFEGERLIEAGKASVAAQMLQAAHEAHSSLTSAAPELQAAGVAEDAANLGARALVLLCWAHLDAGTSCDSALRCVQALQDHPTTRVAASVAAPLLAHRALLQAGRAGEAETELLKVVTHEHSTREICAYAIKAALQAPGGAASARMALNAAQELTSSDDVSLILDLIEAVLGSPPQDSTTTTTTAATNEVILELLEDETLKESIENDAAALQKLHVLCWNTACRLLENGSPSEAAQFHTAAASFLRSSSSSSGGDGNDDVDGKVQACMALALCSTATKNFSEALQYLEQAEQIAPGRLAVAFLRVKTCLAADDESAAAAALQALAASPECDADALRVACCEALECGKPAAAKAALEHLLHKIQDSTAEDASLPAGYESVVLQNLLQIILSDSAADAVSKSIEAAHWFEVGVQRLTTVGLEHYFQNEDGMWRQLEWLQRTAWNAGCAAASAHGNLEAAASLLSRCGELCGVHPAPDAAILRRGHLAHVMAAAAFLDSSSTSETAGVALAAQNLESARSLAAALADVVTAVDAQDSKAQIYSHILEFQVAVRLCDSDAAMAAVEATKLLQAATAEHFIKMAEIVGDDKTHKCMEARKAALAAALTRLTSQPEMNYAAVAGVIRALLECCITDSDRLSTLRDASSLLSSTSCSTTPCFPPLEIRYLITSAWNRGATHSKFARMEEAEAFMGVAVHMLLSCCGVGDEGEQLGLTAHDKERMTEEYSRVQAEVKRLKKEKTVETGGDAASGEQKGDGAAAAAAAPETEAGSTWMMA